MFNNLIAVKLGKFNFRFSSKPITPEYTPDKTDSENCLLLSN